MIDISFPFSIPPYLVLSALMYLKLWFISELMMPQKQHFERLVFLHSLTAQLVQSLVMKNLIIYSLGLVACCSILYGAPILRERLLRAILDAVKNTGEVGIKMNYLLVGLFINVLCWCYFLVIEAKRYRSADKTYTLWGKYLFIYAFIFV